MGHRICWGVFKGEDYKGRRVNIRKSTVVPADPASQQRLSCPSAFIPAFHHARLSKQLEVLLTLSINTKSTTMVDAELPPVPAPAAPAPASAGKKKAPASAKKPKPAPKKAAGGPKKVAKQIGRASCRERVCAIV